MKQTSNGPDARGKKRSNLADHELIEVRDVDALLVRSVVAALKDSDNRRKTRLILRSLFAVARKDGERLSKRDVAKFRDLVDEINDSRSTHNNRTTLLEEIIIACLEHYEDKEVPARRFFIGLGLLNIFRNSSPQLASKSPNSSNNQPTADFKELLSSFPLSEVDFEQNRDLKRDVNR